MQCTSYTSSTAPVCVLTQLAVRVLRPPPQVLLQLPQLLSCHLTSAPQMCPDSQTLGSMSLCKTSPRELLAAMPAGCNTVTADPADRSSVTTLLLHGMFDQSVALQRVQHWLSGCGCLQGPHTAGIRDGCQAGACCTQGLNGTEWDRLPLYAAGH